MYQRFTFLSPEDLDIKNISDFQVHKGFILTLPFRLRIGSFLSIRVGDAFDVIFRNCLDIPYGTPSGEMEKLMWEGKKFRPREQFFTEVLIIDKNVPVPKDFRDQYLAFIENNSVQKMPNSKERYFEALTALNDVIVGYHHATNSLFGGAVVEQVSSRIFFERLRYLHTIITPSGYELSQTELTEILDTRRGKQFKQIEGQFSVDQLDDVPPEQLELIQQYAELHQQFLFYQFALDAKSKMAGNDYVTAILFAVIALEGVTSVLLKMKIDSRLASSMPDAIARAKQVEVIAEQLLKDMGLSKSLDMTSLLFLEVEDRPSENEMKKCKLGITIRNEIMHTLVKKGQYKLRNRTNEQISEAYSNVLKVFNLLVKIVERDNEAII